MSNIILFIGFLLTLLLAPILSLFDGGGDHRNVAENFLIVLAMCAGILNYRNFKRNGNPLIFVTIGFFLFFANRVILYKFFNFPPYWEGDWFYFPQATSFSVLQTLYTGIFFSLSLIITSYLTRNIIFSIALRTNRVLYQLITVLAFVCVLSNGVYSINVFIDVINHGYSNVDASIIESNKILSLLLGAAFPLAVASLLIEKNENSLSPSKVLFFLAILFAMLTGSRGASLGYFLSFIYILILKRNSYFTIKRGINFLSKSDEFKLIAVFFILLLVAVWWGWGRETGGDVPIEISLIGYFVHGQGINILTNFISLESSNIDFSAALKSVTAPLIERFVALVDSDYTPYPSLYRAITLNAFPDLLSYVGNGDLYFNGRGIGGSMLSEFYFLSGANLNLWLVFILISTGWLYLSCLLFQLGRENIAMLVAYFSSLPFFILAFRDTAFAFLNPYIRALLIVYLLIGVWRLIPKKRRIYN